MRGSRWRLSRRSPKGSQQSSIATRSGRIANCLGGCRGAPQRRDTRRVLGKDRDVVLQGRLFPARLHQQPGHVQAERNRVRGLLQGLVQRRKQGGIDTHGVALHRKQRWPPPLSRLRYATVPLQSLVGVINPFPPGGRSLLGGGKEGDVGTARRNHGTFEETDDERTDLRRRSARE